ncbi:MAG: lyase family protein [Lautropia sp.]|nr:lyase family protein [Lautropia sp.]
MFERIFAPASIDSLFSDAAMLAAMARFENGLAHAQSSVGMIPDDAARSIGVACHELGDPAASDGTGQDIAHGRFDPARLYPAARTAGTLAIPFLRALAESIGARSPDAVRYLHYGASHQDLMDSALAMQCKEAGRRLQDMLERVGSTLVQLIEGHQETLLMGRHQLQPTAPIYLAWKLAGWLDPLQRSRRHLRAALLDVAVLQFGGPDGTLASLGAPAERALSVAQRLADALGLLMPAAPWQTSRDRFARLGTELALLCGSLGKMGQDIALLSQAEIGELDDNEYDQTTPGSLPPRPRTPTSSQLIHEAARRAPGLASILLSTMDIEHDGGLSQWQSGWHTLQHIFGATASSLAAAEDLLGRIRINHARMQENITGQHERTVPDILAQALTPRLGREPAQTLVAELHATAREKGWSLRQAVGRDPRISSVMNLGDLERLFDPGGNPGVTGAWVSQIVDAWRSGR